MRQLVPRDSGVRLGGWSLETPASTRRIPGSTFGVVGFGRTRCSIARKLAGFDLEKVFVYDPYVPSEQLTAACCEPATLDELVERSDAVSLHPTLIEESRNLFDRAVIFGVKRGACLIDTSRGGLVDEHALADSLAQGHLHSAAIDVFENENPARTPLAGQSSAILTDHGAWYPVQGQVELQRTTAESAVRYLAGDRDLSIVNRDLLGE